MSWFRFASIYAVLCGVAFFFFPRLSNEIFGINYAVSLHGEDWLRLLGLTGFSYAYLLDAAHSSTNEEIKRIAAKTALIFYVPCILIMIYWQIIPDGRWNRLDIGNIVILCILSYGMFLHSGLMKKKE
jgi:drug/metabolite transporter (DMT)-like permease